MGVTAFPIVSGAQITANDTTAKMEPGTIMAYRTGDQWSLVEYVLLDNNGISQGEVAIQNYATIPAKQYSAAKAAVGDGGAPMKGVAAATIASNRYGFLYVGGYCPIIDTSKSVVTGEYFRISGSTAGKVTSLAASVFNAGTQGNASQFMVVAQAKTTFATGTGSAQIIGVWG